MARSLPAATRPIIMRPRSTPHCTSCCHANLVSVFGNANGRSRTNGKPRNINGNQHRAKFAPCKRYSAEPLSALLLT